MSGYREPHEDALMQALERAGVSHLYGDERQVTAIGPLDSCGACGFDPPPGQPWADNGACLKCKNRFAPTRLVYESGDLRYWKHDFRDALERKKKEGEG